jgi:spore photoproduct lyase
LNTDRVIKEYEAGAPSMAKRLEACKKVIEAGYPVGFLIAPVFIYEDWKNDYHSMLAELSSQITGTVKRTLTFEVISHRYTTRAKNTINEIFPDNQLPMNDEEQKFKYGQFGYGKYIYPKESISEISEFFQSEISALFDKSEIKYVI